jgi:hypothetical protein
MDVAPELAQSYRRFASPGDGQRAGAGTGVAPNPRMAPDGSLHHLMVSFFLALSAAFLWARIPGRGAAFLPAVAGLLITLTIGQVKEMRDLCHNGWLLSPAALRADSAGDMAWNLAGAAAGCLIWGALRLVSLALARCRKAARGLRARGLSPLPAAAQRT